MPTLETQTYNIDFFVLDTNDPKKLILVDQSTYLSIPEKPKLFIIPPGFTGYTEVDYVPNTLIILDSNKLKLTEACDINNLADLPDGVWQITMAVCPYEDLFAKKCYLKTTKLEAEYRDLLLKLDTGSSCIEDKKLKENIIDLDILIQSAKAEIVYCNIEEATQKYKAALNKIQIINKNLKYN